MTWTLSAFADEAGSPIQDQIAALRRAGISHVDLRNVGDHSIASLPVDEAKAVREQLDDAGIRVLMFGSPIGKIDIADDFETDLQRLRHLGEMAKVFDATAVRMFSYYNKAERPLDQWQAESLDRLKKLRDEAQKLGLVLYHENERHIFGDRIDQVEVLADELRDAAHFRLIFDFDNYNQSGDDVWANWQRLKDRTDAFHLKDSNTENMHVPIGEGNGKAPEILADALERGWQGPLTLEPHLSHSAAVMATGPSGQQNQSLKDMSQAECFALAADTAIALLDRIGAPRA